MRYTSSMAFCRRQHITLLIPLVALLWLGWRFSQLHHIRSLSLATQFGYGDASHSTLQLMQEMEVLPPPEGSSLHQTLCHYGICDLEEEAKTTYNRVVVKVQQSLHVETPLLQNISIDLPNLEPLNRTSTLFKESPLPMIATVKTAVTHKSGDASNTIFGVATTIDRLEASLYQFSHWASGNGARLFALVSDCARTEIDEVLQKSHALALDLTILQDDRSMNDRYFELATLMYENVTPSTSWVAFIDDDTFFPSMASLQAMLSRYDTPLTEPYYIGSLSEDLHQLAKHGIIAYGGGGVFLSIGLLSQIYPYLPNYVPLTEAGDSRLAHCILVYTNTKLTIEPRLHQIDLSGDATGFYEALRPQPLSVHHWKSWHRLDMVNASKVSFICGDACIFQKYQFTNGWQMTNGVSIVQYSANYQRAQPIPRMEKTFDDSEIPKEIAFLHSLEPLQEKDERKIQFVLEGAVLENGVVRQFYVRRGEKDARGKTMYVQIIEVAWMRKKTRSFLGR